MVIPTAKEVLAKNRREGIISRGKDPDEKFSKMYWEGAFDEDWNDRNDLKEAMIEFAKLHVKAALEKVYDESKHGDQEHMDWLKAKFDAYPYENIK